MAVNGFNGIGWFLCCVVVAPACYLVTSQVAAERTRLENVERDIVRAHRDLRNLETEFSTRASTAQLARWNQEELAMTAPAAEQYLASETQLASLSPVIGEGETRMAANVPAPVPAVAVRAAQNATADAPVRTAANAVAPDMGGARVVRASATVVPAARGGAHPAPASGNRPAAPVRYADRDSGASGRASRTVAMLEERLISSSTLSELRQAARTERMNLR